MNEPTSPRSSKWQKTVEDALRTGNWELQIGEDGREKLVGIKPEGLKKVDAAIEAYESCQGAKLADEFSTLGITFYTFSANYHQLISLLQKYDNLKFQMESQIWAYDRRDRLDNFLKEVVRLLHNYIVSAKTLVSHSRRMIRRIDSTGAIVGDYKEEVGKRFTKNGLVQFVHGLRNYVLHQNMPSIVATFPGTAEVDGILLRTSILRKSWEGNSIGRAYLDSLSETIRLEELICNYHSEVTSFHRHLEQTLNSEFREEFEELEALRQNAKTSYENFYSKDDTSAG